MPSAYFIQCRPHPIVRCLKRHVLIMGRMCSKSSLRMRNGMPNLKNFVFRLSLRLPFAIFAYCIIKTDCDDPIFIAGPCVIESADLLDEVACELVRIKQKFNIEENVMSERVKMPSRHFLRSDYLHIFFYIKFLVFVSLVHQIRIYKLEYPIRRYLLLLHSHDLRELPIQRVTVLDAYHLR